MRKVMLITGGSRGIGAATAELATTRGYDVCISYVRDAMAADAIRRRCEDLGGNALTAQCDVRDEGAVSAMFDVAWASFGRLDTVVVNAGVVAPQARFCEYSTQRVRDVLEVNVLGAFITAREAVRRLSRRLGGNGGSIVFVSSAAARLGSPNEYIDYAASKGAVDSMTLGLAKEVAAEGVRVNAVRPGLIDTQIHSSAGEPGRVARLAASVPMQRGGRADEVAAAILWLASDEASYVTGAFLDCTGGR